MFNIKKTIVRRCVLISAIIFSGLIYAMNDTFFINAHLEYSIFPYLSIFLLGILMADVYLSNQTFLQQKNYYFDLGGVAGFLLIVYNAGSIYFHQQMQEYLGYILLFLGIFKGRLLNKVFTLNWIMAIGIMCYSIYLLHYALLYFITEKFTASFIQNSYYKNLVIQGVIVLPIVIICCSVFYLVIEKPMNKKK